MSDRRGTDWTSDLSAEQGELLRLLLEEDEALLPDAGSIPRRRDPNRAPLSFDQQRLWFLDRFDPGSPAYNIANPARIDGDLRVAVLADTLSALVERHETLRTTFHLEGEEAVQRIHPPRRQPLPVVDLSGLAGAEDEARRLAGEDLLHPFDLEAGPLLRTTLLRLGAESAVLLVTLHHIISDGWSNGILIREAAALYEAFASGRPSPLPELPIQFGDFAEWQREVLGEEGLAEQLAYWHQRLGGVGRVELPTDRPRPAVVSHRGAIRHFYVPPDLAEALGNLGRRVSASLFMVLLGAFDLLLARYSGSRDVPVGTPIAGRSRVETEGLIGIFVNTLVLRVDLSRRPSFLELLGRVREVTLEAYSHQDVPFDRIVEEVQPERDLSYTPLFQHVLMLQNADRAAEGEGGELAGIRVRGFDYEARTSKFDVVLGLTETARGLNGSWEHSTDLFDAATADRMLAHFLNLLHAVVESPERSVATLDMLSPAELEQARVGWNEAPAFEEGEPLLHRRFRARAEERPEAVAVIDGDDEITYGELEAWSNRLARRLLEAGAGPEERVLVVLQRSAAVAAAILAVHKAGAAYLPATPGTPAERLGFLLADAGARLAVADGEGAAQLARLAPELTLLDPHAARGGEAASGLPPRLDTSPEQLAYVIYTSGSTGKPKGVPVPHRSQARLFDATREDVGFGPDDVWTFFHSYAFDFSVWELWGPLAHGGRVVVVPEEARRSPEAFLALLAAEGVTVLSQTPSAFRLLDAAEAAARAAGEAPELALRAVTFGGEALDPKTLAGWMERFGEAGPRLINLYGITEITVHATYRPIEPSDLEGAGASVIGAPLRDLAIHVLDPDGNLCPPGVIGDLHVGGPGVARGYLGRPGLTAERFVPDGQGGEAGARLYRSGDLAFRRPDGDLVYVGRADHQVKVRGFRIELGEIDAALREHPEVAEAVVAARPAGDGVRLAAYLVPASGSGAGDSLSVTALRDFLARRLPEHMVPAFFVRMEALPLTVNGKVDRAALPDPDADSLELGQGYVAPRTAEEEILTAVWAQLLDVERVGVNDSFFALGGDSILSIRMLAMVREQGLDFSLQDLFRLQTVARLAANLDLETAADRPAEPTEPFSLVRPEDLRQLPEGLVDAYPVADLQAGMLYQMDLVPDYPPYHNVDSWRLRGRFDEAAFREAVGRVVERHPILRTGFELTAYSEPLQLVYAEAALPIEITDLRDLPEGEQQERVDVYCAAEKRDLFDFREAPQLRFHVHLLADDLYQFTLTENHAIFDGWSLHATLAEIFDLYLRLMEGETPERAAPLAAVYRDFVALERAAMASEEAAAYWDEQLRELPQAELARWNGEADRPRGPRARTLVDIPTEVLRGLVRLSRDAAVPFKSVFFTAHAMVLYLLAGRREVVTGYVVNGRQSVEDGEQVRGLFLNNLPFRYRAEESTWRDEVRRVFRRERELLPFRRFPMGELQRRLGGRPLFEAMFTYVHFHVVDEVLRTGGVEVVDGQVLEGTELPLQVTFTKNTVIDDPSTPYVGLDLESDTNRFSRAHLTEIGRLFRRVLAGMATEPGANPRTASFLDPGERQMLLREWNDSRRPVVEAGATLHGLFEAQVRRTPGAAALRFGEETLSFAELDDRANRLAGRIAGLLADSGAAEPVVGVAAERSPGMVAALLAVLKAGAAYLPLAPDLPAERAAYMLRDAGASVVVAAGLPDAAEAAALLGEGAGGVRVLAVDAHGLDTGGMEPEGDEGGAGEGAIGDLQPAVDPDRLAYVIYTSGSTGRPKAVMVPHRAILNRLGWMQAVDPIGPGDRVLQKTPFSFDASIWEIFLPLHTGAEGVLAAPGAHREVDAMLAAVREQEVTVLQLVPSLLGPFVDQPDVESAASLRRLYSGGEALRTEVARRALERLPVELRNLYGPTEAAIDAASWRCRADRLEDGGVAPIGRPIANDRVYLLDGALQPAQLGARGEIHLAGTGLARGYLGRPGLTAERFVPCPFGPPGGRMYRTGDLGRLAPDGTIGFLGRADDQVKLRGYRVELGEIEACLADHERIAQAVVVPEGRGASTEALRAYLILASEPAPTLNELGEHLRERLPEYMAPASFRFVETFPRTPSGKLDRRALAETEGVEAELEKVFVAPRDELEAELAALFAEVLKRDRVGVTDDFFESGGHSLMVMALISRVRKTFEVELGLRSLFTFPTVELLAAEIRRQREEAGAPGAAPATGASIERVSEAADAAEDVDVDDVQELSDEEVERMLGSLLDEEDS